jgi:hypothetical protein
MAMYDDQIEEYMMDRHAVCMRKKKHALKSLVGKSERKRPCWSYRCRRDDNIKIDFNEIRR